MYRYQSIVQELKVHLADGEYRDGRLPSERVLMARFGVNRSTIRRALAALQLAGLIKVERNRRPFVVGDAESDPVEIEELVENEPAQRSELTGNIILSVQTIRESTARFDIETGIKTVLASQGLGISYHDPARSHIKDSGLPDSDFLDANNALGAVVWAPATATARGLQRLSRQLPIVLVDRQVAGFDSDFVGFDDEGGGRLATEHLIRLGHRHIGFLSSEVGAETVNGRWRGYRAALIDAGIEPLDEWALQLNALPSMPDILAFGYIDRFIRQTGSPLTAVVCTSDGAAATLIANLRASGRTVPGDVAVVGYGDLLPNVWRAFGLTTIAQSFVEIGQQAAEILHSRLVGENQPSVNHEVRLPIRLVVRGSCGTPPHTKVATN